MVDQTTDDGHPRTEEKCREQLLNEKYVAEAIVDAVADAKGVDPVELTPPVFQYIDPNALEVLCETATPSLEIQFVAWECNINIQFDQDGYDITVQE